MFRTVAIIARMCRTSTALHSRFMPPAVVNSVRHKYQNHSGGGGDRSGRRKSPSTAHANEENDVVDATSADYNLLEDK